MSYLDLVGKRFGQLTVEKYMGRDREYRPLYRCICDCGVAVNVLAYDLLSGKTTTCGEHHYKDLKGLKFGNLTCIEKVDTDYDGRAIWLCRCDCGKEMLARADNLKSGHTTSCGCNLVKFTKYNRDAKGRFSAR